jgi:hypothetical protein
MKVKLSKAAVQLREQIDDSFPDRERASDGWIGDTRHAARKSDHIPDEQGWVRAIDVSAGLFPDCKPDIMPDLVDQLRRACKSKQEKRISYIIYDRESAHPSLDGDGASTKGRTHTLSTLTLALRRRLTYWVSFIKYLC